MPTLAQARRGKSLTQRQLAEKLGVQRTLVSSWERGVHRPGPKNLAKLGEILGVASSDLEFNPGPKRPEASAEERRRQIQAHEEAMGYVDSTWLRGGRYDVDPAFHEKSST